MGIRWEGLLGSRLEDGGSSGLEIGGESEPLTGSSSSFGGLFMDSQDALERAARRPAWSGVLARMSGCLSESASAEDVLRCLACVALPALGDWCDVDLVQDGVLERVAAFRSPHGAIHGPSGGAPAPLA